MRNLRIRRSRIDLYMAGESLIDSLFRLGPEAQ